MIRELLKSGSVGQIEINHQKKLRESITNRWEQLSFLDGLNGQLK